ncbi:MAG: peptidoglycan DD-metalloendopeptidase family protein [Abditibacteriota bacterium]|nr:peptidoglycan DD-metalloendopeptidase family protein [Abditibacteriota bacterium]
MNKLRAALLAFALCLCVSALPADTLNNQLKKVESKISSINKELKQKKIEKSAAVSRLRQHDKQLEQAQSQVARSQIKLAQARTELEAVDSRLEIAQKNLDRREALLRRRIVDIYEGGDIDYLNVFLNTTDMWDFVTHTYYIKKMIEYDSHLIKQIKLERNNIRAEKAKKEEAVRRLQSAQKELIYRRNKVAKVSKEKRAAVQKIENDRRQLELALRAKEKESARIEKKIREYLRSQKGKSYYYSGPKIKGKLPLPCAGRISSRFGMRFHPIRKRYKLHTGVDIAAPTGTAIHASAAGVVLSAGWSGAYGNAVILQHGGGVSTLYGHCSRVLVRKGQKVSKGQVIAKVGSTGYSTGPHCHFEKRVNGKPVNPM